MSEKFELEFHEVLHDLLETRGVRPRQRAKYLADLLFLDETHTRGWLRGAHIPGWGSPHLMLIATRLALPDEDCDRLERARRHSLITRAIERAGLDHRRASEASALVWRTFGRVVRRLPYWVTRRLETRISGRPVPPPGAIVRTTELWNDSDAIGDCTVEYRDRKGAVEVSWRILIPVGAKALIRDDLLRLHDKLDRYNVMFLCEFGHRVLAYEYRATSSGGLIELSSASSTNWLRTATPESPTATLPLIAQVGAIWTDMKVCNANTDRSALVTLRLHRADLGGEITGVIVELDTGVIPPGASRRLAIADLVEHPTAFVGSLELTSKAVDGPPAEIYADASIHFPDGRAAVISAETDPAEVAALRSYLWSFLAKSVDG